MEQSIEFRANFLPWMEQKCHVPASAIKIIQELPDRLFFEDPANLVIAAFLAANKKPIISQPSNHGTWVSLSIRWEDAPSCQMVVCRRTKPRTSDDPAVPTDYELFYGVDFDKAPWTTKRLDWMARHTMEVFCNKITRETTDQSVIRFGLMQSGITFPA